jgi:hypothetical protein
MTGAHFTAQGLEARIHFGAQISDVGVQFPDHGAQFALVGVIQHHAEEKNREDNEADCKYVGHLATPCGYVVFQESLIRKVPSQALYCRRLRERIGNGNRADQLRLFVLLDDFREKAGVYLSAF